MTANWLDGNEIHLNCDLVAVIGNKGSGKSALTDVIALLGNTQNTSKFSFLRKERFRNPKQKLAENFTGSLTWLSNTGGVTKLLSDDTDSSKVELVRYIPQSYFEDLCNDHASGGTTQFQEELESVIFSHVPSSVRGEALNFQQLIKIREEVLEDGLAEHSKSMKQANIKISTLEEEMSPKYKAEIEELIKLKEIQISEHKKIKPKAPAIPSGSLNKNQQKAADEINKFNERAKAIEIELEQHKIEQVNSSNKSNSISSIKGRLEILIGQIELFEASTAQAFSSLDLKIKDVFSYKINKEKLSGIKATIDAKDLALTKKISLLDDEAKKIGEKKAQLQKQLNAPQQKYQEELAAVNDWDIKQKQLVGATDIPESLEGLKTRLAQIKAMPATLANLKSERVSAMRKIFQVLNEKRQLREKLFAPLQELLDSNLLIKNEYQLNFQAILSYSTEVFANQIADYFKQTHDLSSQNGVSLFIDEIVQKLINSAQEMPVKIGPGIAAGMKANKLDVDLYDYLYGLEFLNPRYTLMFQNTPIEFLSPGQRGALLLIFYLLVDTGHIPIILDQPEENLDNQTIVSLLVPVLTEAKKRRQIIMVTHNPNLAVVCDAEQVVYAKYDKANGNKIEYISGSIEHPAINLHTVNVLEGTKVAFDNRKAKYHDQI